MNFSTKNKLVVPAWFYAVLKSDGFDVITDKYCRDDTLIYVDKEGRVRSFRSIRWPERDFDDVPPPPDEAETSW